MTILILNFTQCYWPSAYNVSTIGLQSTNKSSALKLTTHLQSYTSIILVIPDAWLVKCTMDVNIKIYRKENRKRYNKVGIVLSCHLDKTNVFQDFVHKLMQTLGIIFVNQLLLRWIIRSCKLSLVC